MNVAMKLDQAECYQALLTRDARFDGAFFVGVATTGIYCRPVCPARTPRPENCAYFRSAASAEQSGYRPCLRCRPELAPGGATIDAVGRLASAVADRLADGSLGGRSVEAVAAELGVSARHLRRVVKSEFGVSPIQLAQTQRLHLAKRLLTDTNLPVIEVAYESGFASLRRFNHLFRSRYRLSPTDLRKGKGRRASPQPTLVCHLAYRPPLNWSALLAFLAPRALPGVEWVDGDCYRRGVAIGAHRGWIAVTQAAHKPALRVELSSSLTHVLMPVLSRVKRLFDLGAEPRQIDARLGELAADAPGLRVPGAFDSFELAVRAILGQQVSVQAARTLAGRFAAAFGEPLVTPFPAIERVWPTADVVAQVGVDEIAALGMPGSRARAVLALAEAVHSGALRLEPGMDVAATIAQLTALPGIGDWTAQYIAMRTLGWPDAFPQGDLGLRKALGDVSPGEAMRRAEEWRPWRAYAVMHLWRRLEETT